MTEAGARVAASPEVPAAAEAVPGRAGLVPEVEFVPWDMPDAVALRQAAVAELGTRYGGDEDAKEYIDPASIVTTILVRIGGVAAAGGSVRDVSGTHDGVGGVHPAATGEVKRVFVAAEQRRNGLGRLVMDALEQGAREAGLERLVLETGTEQPESIAMYQRLGFAAIAKYGKFADSDRQRCYGKSL